jgi:glutathione S-transferase
MLTLISATPSPYARKVRIALAEKGLPFELRTEVPWESTTATPQHNPLEKLPVLILDDGSSVYESHFILEWLEAKYPQPPLVPADIDGRLFARRVEVVADGVCDALVSLFWERQRTAPSAPWMARQMRKVDGGVRALEAWAEGRRFIQQQFGLADIATGAACGYLDVRFPDHPWRARHPGLAAYANALASRPSFQATVPTPQSVRGPVVT